MTAPRSIVWRLVGALLAALRGLLVAVTFVLVLVGSLLVHLDLPVVRRVVVDRVNHWVFQPLFRGTFVITKLDHVDPFGVRGAAVRVSDPAGRPVLIVDGVDGRFATLALLESVFVHPHDLTVDIPRVSIHNVDIRLDLDASGVAIANAFFPRTPSTGPDTPPDGHGPHVFAPHIHIDHAWGHGLMTGLPYLDGDVTQLDAAFALFPDHLTVDAKRGAVDARGIALGADAKGTFDGHYEMTLGETPVLGGHATWNGAVGTLAETAKFAIEQGHFDASLDVPNASPDDVRSLWAASPIDAPGLVHLEAHGPYDAIAVTAHAGLGPATADVAGQIHWGDAPQASAHLDVANVDLRAFSGLAPASSLGVRGELQATLPAAGGIDLTTDLDLVAGRIAGQPTPSGKLHATASRSRDGAFGGDATLSLDEPGAPTTVTVHAVPKGSSAKLEFTALTRGVNLGAVRPIAAGATGSARLWAKGELDLDTSRFDVAVSARGDSIARTPLKVQSLTLDGHARGTFVQPTLDLTLHAEGIQAGSVDFQTVDVAAHGRERAPHVNVQARSATLPSVDADFDVDLQRGVSLQNADVRATRSGETAHVRAARVRFTGGVIAVDRLVVEGAGEPVTASFEKAGDTVRLSVKAPRVDLGRVAKLLNFDGTLKKGMLAVDSDLSIRASGATGHAHVTLTDGEVETLGEVSGHIDGNLEGRRFTGKASANLGDFGQLDLDARQIAVGGTGSIARASFRKLFGDVGLQGHVDLAKLTGRLKPGTLPASDLRGTVELQGRLQRDSTSDVTPLVELTATTHGLFVGAGNVDATEQGPKRRWKLEGVDVVIGIHINGETGALDWTTHVADHVGDLAVLGVKASTLPYEALAEDPSRAWADLERVPFEATLTLPPRELTSWPKGLGHVPIDGLLQGTLALKGPLTTPHAELDLKLSDVKGGLARISAPLEADVKASYDGEQGRISVRGRRQSHELLTVEAQGAVRATDLVLGNPDPPWSASAKVHLDDFPLVTIGALDDRQVRGRLSGDVVLDNLHADAKATATINIKELKVGETAYPTATASFKADGQAVSAEARLDQTDGYLAVKAKVGATWGSSIVPVPDAAQNLDLTLDAKAFRAAVILPFVQGSVDQLDGVVTGSANAVIDPRTKKVTVEGSLGLTSGLFQLADFGGELHDIAGHLAVTREGLVTLDHVVASGVSGQLQAAATARLDGLRLAGASATVQIPKSRPLPLSVGGSQLGMIDGRINLTESLSSDRRTLDVKVDVPTLHVVLPESGSQDVQALGKMNGIKIGRRPTPGGRFVVESLDPEEDEEETAKTERPEDATQLRVTTHLGSDVALRRGTDLRVELTGGPTVTVAQTTRVSGQIQLHGGVLNLYGKTFDIENGTVTFVGDDPSNPQVSVTAGWSAADGTQVKADFIGPLKTGKVTLRSEPPLPRDEIVQLLLFGTTDGQVAAAQGGGAPGTSSAEGVAGNIATQPLNRALDQFGLSAVSAKVDTSSVNAKPEVEVQIAKNITVELAHILYIGPPPPGSAPDTTLLTVDWRFLKKWSLQTTVGDAGSTIVDLVWQYRY